MNILNRLTIKHLTMNKKRTIVTIVGIILSAALMVGIGTIASTFRDYMIQDMIEQNGPWHAKLFEVPKKNLTYIENNVDVKETYERYALGYAKLENGENAAKPYLYIEAANENHMKTSKLLEGRLPQNSHELLISKHIYSNGGVELHVGDTITLSIGNRYLEGADGYLMQENPYDTDEILTEKQTRSYTIVGIMDRRTDENYSAPGYTVFTCPKEDDLKENDFVVVGIEYKNPRKSHELTEQIAKTVESPLYEIEADGKTKQKPMVDYNESVLALYGASSYDSFNSVFISLFFIIIFLIAIGCALVIYNSFAISVMERKKQFGLFSSIGATRQQIRKTVFFEALIVGLIGIPIGVLGGIFGIWTVIQIINYLLPSLFTHPLTLSLYPTFLIIPIIYMMITVFLSAFLPAYQASRISPIRAIRLNDDIKIKSRKLKTPHFAEKLYGMEGTLALKNMRRNKKKYRITIISLVVSIVLYIGFSTFVDYGMVNTNHMMNIEDFDISIAYSSKDRSYLANDFDKIRTVDGIDDIIFNLSAFDMSMYSVSLKVDPKKDYTKEYYDYIKTFNQEIEQDSQEESEEYGFHIQTLDDISYANYIKKLGLDMKDYNGEELKFILANKIQERDYENQKYFEYEVYNFKSGIRSFQFYSRTKDTLRESYTQEGYDESNDYTKEVREVPVYITNIHPDMARIFPTIYISESMVESLVQLFPKTDIINPNPFYSLDVKIKAKNHVEVEKELKKVLPSEVYIWNYSEEAKMQKNLVLVVGILLYGFITLVTLIGVTSVFNTITTSIALRRKEFAVLRSIGLSPKGFSKMIRFESFLYGLKALLVGLPLSMIVVLLFNQAFSNLGTQNLLIPWKSILICVVAVFFITFMTMLYATRKMKKENILDAIREENI